MLCCATVESFALTTLSNFPAKAIPQKYLKFSVSVALGYVSVYVKFDEILFTNFSALVLRGGFSNVKLHDTICHHMFRMQQCFSSCPNFDEISCFF